MSLKALLRLSAAVGALGISAQVALAQTTANPTSGGIEEIIVTANKRPENVQNVPQSVFVATPEILERTSVRDFDDLVRIAPDLTVAKTTQPANNSINIRGVGTYAYSIATEASVGVLVDDVPQTFQAEAFNALTDAAQVVVLRGPQSSLFGKAASAGVIEITTNAPTDVFSTGAQALATTDGEYRANGFVSGPISDDVKARLTMGYDDYKGSLYNVYDGHWINGHADFNTRAKVQWTPNTDWTFTLTPYYDNTRASCCTETNYFVSPGVTFGKFGSKSYQAAQVAVLNGTVPGPENHQVSEDVDPRGDATDMGIDQKAEYRFDGFLLSVISSYDRYDLHDLQDTDMTAFNWGPGGANVTGAIAGGSANGGYFKVNSITQELRITSPDSGRFRYVAGFYFSDVHGEASFVRGSNMLTQDGTLTTTPPTTSAYASYVDHAYDLNYAVYGQSTFDITDELGLVTGVRLNRDDLDYRFYDRLNKVVYGYPTCSTHTPSGLVAQSCSQFDSITGRAELEYHVTPSIMVFGGYDRGNKGQAFDLTSSLTTRTLVASGPGKGFPIADAIASNQPVSPETVNAYQAGWKSELFDNQLVWNVTAFDEIFHHFQAQTRDPNTLQNELNSLGSVTTKGVETELTAAPYQGLTVNAAGAYDEAIINTFNNAACFPSQTAALGCVGSQQNIHNARLNNAPRWTANLNAEYDYPMADNYTLFATSTWHWQSSEIFNILQDPDSLQKSYGLFNVGLGVETSQWKLTLLCNNVFNQSYALYKTRNATWNINPYGASAGPITDAIEYAPGRDSIRYFGVQLGFTY